MQTRHFRRFVTSPVFCRRPKLEGTENRYQSKRAPKRQVFKTQKTCNFDTPFVLIPLWVLQKRHPNGYQNKQVPKCLVFRHQKTCHFDTPSVLIPVWALPKKENHRFPKTTVLTTPNVSNVREARSDFGYSASRPTESIIGQRAPSVQNYYIASPHFWTMNLGRRKVKITLQKLYWNYFRVP